MDPTRKCCFEYSPCGFTGLVAFTSLILVGICFESMQSIYRAGGARKFAVQNLGPLGCLPITRQEFKTGEKCMEMVNFMAKTHNERLSGVLFSMTVPLLYRGFRYSLFDFNGEILRRINEPSLHGN